jgi:hypothetical protein
VLRVAYIVWWRDVGDVRRCECRTSDGQVFWVGGPSYRSCKDYEAWEREEGRRVWCYDDPDV